MTIAWFSAGVTSTIACKLALKKYPDVQIFYIDTGSEHPDNERYLKDCEKWFGQEIEIRRNSKYTSAMDVWQKKRFINSPNGAPCTFELKKKVRYAIEDELKIYDRQIFGFDNTELLRAKRFTEQNCTLKPEYPLIDADLSKRDCMAILLRIGIELPAMYRLGYHNNNCIGCCKGGMGYWNKIRYDFPDVFTKMARLERDIGHTCIKDTYLDQLDLHRGHYPQELEPECSIFCEPEFQYIS